MAGDAPSLEGEADGGARRALLGDPPQRVGAAEVALGELDRPAQPGAVGVDGLVHVLAVEAQPRLETEGVAGAEPGGDEPAVAPGVEQRVPELAAAVGVDVDLHPVLAGVPGARDHRRGGVDARDPCSGAPEGTQVTHLRLAERGDDVDGTGTLHRDERDPVADVGQLGVGEQVGAHPGDVLLPGGRVDDDEEAILWRGTPPFPLEAAIDDDVVDDPAGLGAHHPVERAPRTQPGDVVGDQALDRGLGAGAGEQHLAHVGDVEDAGAAADGEVLVADPRVLERHLVTAELDHPRPEGDVAVPEGSAPGHGGRL